MLLRLAIYLHGWVIWRSTASSKSFSASICNQGTCCRSLLRLQWCMAAPCSALQQGVAGAQILQFCFLSISVRMNYKPSHVCRELTECQVSDKPACTGYLALGVGIYAGLWLALGGEVMLPYGVGWSVFLIWACAHVGGYAATQVQNSVSSGLHSGDWYWACCCSQSAATLQSKCTMSPQFLRG